jgi:hypothetical protein
LNGKSINFDESRFVRKRKTTVFQDIHQDNLMKELENLNKDKRNSINTNKIRNNIQNRNLGQKLLDFNAKEFDDDLINFYLGDPDLARKNAPGYTEPIVSSMKTNGKL